MEKLGMNFKREMVRNGVQVLLYAITRDSFLSRRQGEACA
jgi:hypothetical protein